jgi:signal transduction histidine kinase
MSADRLSKEIASLKKKNRDLEEKLQAAKLSEKRFLDALRLSPMALCHHDRDLRYEWLYNGHMGFVQNEVIGKTDWDILDQDLADRMGAVKQRVLDTGIGERVEMPTVAGNENSEYFDLVVEPLRDEVNGDIVGLSCSGIDVTEDRRRREAYKASEENLQFIFNASPMPILVTHLESGAPLFFNSAANDLFDLKHWCERSDHSLGILEGLGVSERIKTAFQDHLAVLDFAFEFQRDSDEVLHLAISATPIFYDGDSAILSTFHDFTNEENNRRRLEEAKEKAEQANAAKSQFLASASHDLRQPLHAMGLLLSVLKSYIQDEKGLEVFKRVTLSLESMNDLFAGILDISKFDANAVSLQVSSVDVAKVFKTLETDFRAMAEESGINLRIVPCHLCVQTDAIQFERMLRNLLSNAIRYTQKGRVLLGCRRKGSDLVFYVCDTGIGVSQDDQDVIFQEFRQVGNRERDRRKGLGLGLAICERISQLLNTRIELTSEVNKGSVFSFKLPQADSSYKEQKELTNDDLSLLKGRHILFIDDEVDVRIATKYMLEAWGCVALLAESAVEARELLSSTKSMPDVIVADYRLRRGENGIDAILSIRKQLNKKIPAFLVSGETSSELMQEVSVFGLPLLNKPLMAHVFCKTIVDLISRFNR